MDSYDIFQETFSTVKSFGNIMGFDLFSEQFKMNIRIIVTTILAISVTLCAFYSCYINDFEGMLKVGIIICLGVQVCIDKMKIKLQNNKEKKSPPKAIFTIHSIIFQRKLFKNMADFLKKVYTENKNSKNLGHDKIIIYWSLLAFRATKILYYLYEACAVAYSLVPFGFYLFAGGFELSFPLYLPGIDANNTTGLFVTYLYQCACFFAATFGFGFFDSTYVIFTINVRTLSVLIKYEWEQLNDKLARKAKLSDIRAHFRNLCAMHDEMTG